MYKLNFELGKIISPIYIIEPFDMRFDNGRELVKHEFEKWYLVKSIEAICGEIQIELEENKQMNKLDWLDREAASFF